MGDGTRALATPRHFYAHPCLTKAFADTGRDTTHATTQEAHLRSTVPHKAHNLDRSVPPTKHYSQ